MSSQFVVIADKGVTVSRYAGPQFKSLWSITDIYGESACDLTEMDMKELADWIIEELKNRHQEGEGNESRQESSVCWSR